MRRLFGHLLAFGALTSANGARDFRTTWNYTVSATRLSSGLPLVDKIRVPGSSAFDYNYNPASFTRVNPTSGMEEQWLMVRVQNKTVGDEDDPWSYGGASLFAVAQVYSPTNVSYIDDRNIVFGDGEVGVEDPRIVLFEGIYYMYYTLTDVSCTPNACARLALATCAGDPTTKSCWVNEGPLWPHSDVAGFQWTKSGAVLLSDDLETRKHFLFWSNWCEFEPLWVSPLYVQVAVSDNLRDWTILPSPAFDKRLGDDSFDSYVLESGPPPVKLSTGDYLFMYNGAWQCPTGKPNYERCYALGWVILDGDDPTRVIARAPANEPMLVSEEEWEVGNPDSDQTPNVVFADGSLYHVVGDASRGRITNAASAGDDHLVAFYGGSDTAIGSLAVTVTMAPLGSDDEL